MKGLRTTLTLVGLVAAGTAHATTVGDLLADGYQILRTTSVAGQFLGCEKDHEIVMLDATTVFCGNTRRTHLDNPRVVIFRNGEDNTHVLLIGDHTYGGSLLQLGSRKLTSSISLTAIDEAPPLPASQARTDNRIGAIQPIDSIESLRREDHLDLRDAQRFPLPAPTTATATATDQDQP